MTRKCSSSSSTKRWRNREIARGCAFVNRTRFGAPFEWRRSALTANAKHNSFSPTRMVNSKRFTSKVSTHWLLVTLGSIFSFNLALHAIISYSILLFRCFFVFISPQRLHSLFIEPPSKTSIVSWETRLLRLWCVLYNSNFHEANIGLLIILSVVQVFIFLDLRWSKVRWAWQRTTLKSPSLGSSLTRVCQKASFRILAFISKWSKSVALISNLSLKCVALTDSWDRRPYTKHQLGVRSRNLEPTWPKPDQASWYSSLIY